MITSEDSKVRIFDGVELIRKYKGVDAYHILIWVDDMIPRSLAAYAQICILLVHSVCSRLMKAFIE